MEDRVAPAGGAADDHSRSAGPRRALVVGLLGVAAAAAAEPVHLMFPHDYLSLPEPERYQYVLGVIDARLTEHVNSTRLPALVACVTGAGVDRIRRVAETEIIPRPGAAATPMPWVVDQALREACPEPPPS